MLENNVFAKVENTFGSAPNATPSIQLTPGAGGTYIIEHPGDELMLVEETKPEPPKD
jgi:hypothetical protein